MNGSAPKLLLATLAMGLALPVSAHATSEDATTASRVEAANLTIVEGTGGVTQAVFTIKLKYTPTGSQDYVEYEILPRTAMPGEDYEPIPAGRLDFAASETEKTLTVNVLADDRPECPEGFVLRLQHWFHGKPMDVTATIVDDDGVDSGVGPEICPDPLALDNSTVGVDAGVVPPAFKDAGAQPDPTTTNPTAPPATGVPASTKSAGCSFSQGRASMVWPLAVLGLLAVLRRRARKDLPET